MVNLTAIVSAVGLTEIVLTVFEQFLIGLSTGLKKTAFCLS